MAVLLAFVVLGGDLFPALVEARESLSAGITPRFGLGLVIYPALVYLLVWLPIKKMRESALPETKIE